jgi:phage terminase large subunit-like protein
MQVMDIRKATKTLYGFRLTAGQIDIIGQVVDPTIKRLIISCMTRYGKTQVVAIALLRYILVNTNKRVLIIAPTLDQTNIIRNYVAEIIADDPELSSRSCDS